MLLLSAVVFDIAAARIVIMLDFLFICVFCCCSSCRSYCFVIITGIWPSLILSTSILVLLSLDICVLIASIKIVINSNSDVSEMTLITIS